MITTKKILLSCGVLFVLLFSMGCSKKSMVEEMQSDSYAAGAKSKVTTLALHTYYVAPNGSDTNPGTFEQPFLTITKAQSVAVPGDDIYFRGGTYVIQESMTNRIETTYNRIFYLNKSGTASARIQYMNYPGESPVFDFSNVQPSKRITAFMVIGSYITLKGIDIKAVQATLTGDNQSECIRNSGSYNVYENLKMRDGEAIGFYLSAGGNNLVLNCDAYNNWDRVAGDGLGGDTDGFGIHPNAAGRGYTGNVVRGCRAWFNSDDGFDCISAYEAVTIENCWAFYNGYSSTFQRLSNGLGFKVGGYGTDQGSFPSVAPRHVIRFNLAVYNKTAGFYANHHTGGEDWISNTAYKNPTNYNMLCRDPQSNQDVPGFDHNMYNNLGYAASYTEFSNLDLAKSTTSNNYFNLSGQITVDAADFESLDESFLTAQRNADFSLPQTPFARLVSGSDLIDKGKDVGFPFNGNVPDLGCFEASSGGTTPPPTVPSAPTGLTATAGNSQVSLSWTSVSGATSYNVKRSTSSGGPYSTVASGLTSASFTNTGLSNGTTYYYVVSAVNSAGESTNSSQISAMPQSAAQLPEAPTGITATAGNAKVSLAWNSVSTATSYNIKRSTTSGGPYTTVATGVASTMYSVSSLTNGTTYYFVISASNSAGEGANSSEVSAMPKKGK